MSNSTRSSSPSTSSYDERYVVPLEASRRGAHRARVSPVVAALPVVAVIGIVVGAIALVGFFLGNLSGGGSTTAQVSQASPSASASAAASAAATPTDAASASPSASAAAADVDKTVTLSVYNGSGVAGLARKAADKLTADGWTVGTTANWAGGTLTETTIYYGADSHRASAQAIAKLLGHGTVKLSAARAGAGVAVVVGHDYAAAAGQGTAASVTAKPRTSPTKAGTAGTGKTTPSASAKASRSPAAADPAPSQSPAA